MDFSYLTGGALALITTAVIAGWRQVRGFWTYISGYAIVRIISDQYVSACISEWLLDVGKRSPFTSMEIGNTLITRRDTLKNEHHIYLSLWGDGLYWIGWRPIWIGKSSAGGAEHARTISYIRGTFTLEGLAVECAAYMNRAKTRRFCVTYIQGREKGMIAVGGKGDSPQPVSGGISSHQAVSSPTQYVGMKMLTCDQSELGGIGSSKLLQLDEMSLSVHQRGLSDEFGRWLANRKWYVERGVPWKFGATLYGAPGTGKTTFVRSLAIKHDLPVYVFDLSTMSSQEFVESWNSIKTNTPCIAIFDDIDSVFDGTTVINVRSGLSFDTFLQSLSGITELDGVAFFINTNYIEKVAPSLLRPGRAGRKVEFTSCDKERALCIIKRLLDFTDADVQQAVAAIALDMTPDAVTQLCVQIVLAIEHGMTVGEAISYALQYTKEPIACEQTA